MSGPSACAGDVDDPSSSMAMVRSFAVPADGMGSLRDPSVAREGRGRCHRVARRKKTATGVAAVSRRTRRDYRTHIVMSALHVVGPVRHRWRRPRCRRGRRCRGRCSPSAPRGYQRRRDVGDACIGDVSDAVPSRTLGAPTLLAASRRGPHSPLLVSSTTLRRPRCSRSILDPRRHHPRHLSGAVLRRVFDASWHRCGLTAEGVADRYIRQRGQIKQWSPAKIKKSAHLRGLRDPYYVLRTRGGALRKNGMA